MCGIGFIVRMGDSPIDKTQLDAMLIGLQRRGQDASGVALQRRDGEIHVYKTANAASRFVEMQSYKSFLSEKLDNEVVIALVHTRHMTTGHWSDNKNNHPLEGEHVVMVHNGMIANYRSLFEKLSLEPRCQTDSDIMRAILDKHQLDRAGVRELEKVQGSAAIAVLDRRKPGQLLIARSGNPIEVALTEHFIFGASLMQPIFVANKSWRKKWGFYAHTNSSKLERVIMPTETAWLIDRAPTAGEPGVQWHQEFKLDSGWSGGVSCNWSDEHDLDWEKKWADGTYQALCDCGHMRAAHKGDDKTGVCWISTCKCKAYKSKFAKEKEPELDMSPTGVEYECGWCKKVNYVPMYLNKDKYSPGKLTCSHCERYMTNATVVTGRI